MQWYSFHTVILFHLYYTQNVIFLPPATKLGQGYIFTGMCDSVHRGGLPQCILGYHSLDQAHPQTIHPPTWSRHPPTPLWSRHPPGADTPPGAEHAERYGQCAGGMHPVGMQSCLPFGNTQKGQF